MKDTAYTSNLVYYPAHVARVRLPLGLPAGLQPILLDGTGTVFNFDVCSVHWLVNAVESFDPEGIAPKNPLPADFKKEGLRYVPIMREYGLDGAADHMHAWVMGTLPLEPLLDVSASPGYSSSCNVWF